MLPAPPGRRRRGTARRRRALASCSPSAAPSPPEAPPSPARSSRRRGSSLPPSQRASPPPITHWPPSIAASFSLIIPVHPKQIIPVHRTNSQFAAHLHSCRVARPPNHPIGLSYQSPITPHTAPDSPSALRFSLAGLLRRDREGAQEPKVLPRFSSTIRAPISSATCLAASSVSAEAPRKTALAASTLRCSM